MSTTIPLSVRTALHENPLFPLVDQHAVRVLATAVTGEGEDVDDAFVAVLKKTRYYRNAQQQRTISPYGVLIDLDGQGDLINGCFEAALLLGLAFGLRLRGAA